MDFSLTDAQKSRRKEIVEFARSTLNQGVFERDQNSQFSKELWMACASRGLTGLAAPDEFGGGGLDPVSTILALEAFGYGCEDGGLVFTVGAHLLACVVPLAMFGTPEQKNSHLSNLCNGSRIGANAMTEPGAGSDMGSIATTAEQDGDGYRINGTKTLITNTGIADLITVFAVTDAEKRAQGGISAFLIPADTPGLKTETQETMGFRTTPIGTLKFDDVRVPADALIGGREGIGTAVFQHAMNWERIGLFAAHAGMMERVLEKVIQRARTRKQFDQAIGKFQAVSHRIVDMKVRLEAAKLLAYKAASRLDQARDVALDASIVKLFIGEAWLKTARDALQIFGGAGFLTECEVERFYRDATGATLYSGTSEIQRNIIAGWLGL